MDPILALTIESKIKSVQECDVSLKQNRLSQEDLEYTSKMKARFLKEIDTLVSEHPELAHHPALLKLQGKSINLTSSNQNIKTDLKS